MTRNKHIDDDVTLFSFSQSSLKLAPSALLVPTNLAAKRFMRLLPEAGEVNNRTLFGSVELGIFRDINVVSPIFGSPAAALILEQLVRADVKQIIFCGVVGALALGSSAFGIGDIIFPTGAISETGVVKLYGANESIALTSEQFQNTLQERLLRELESERQSRIHRGVIWSTDAPALETHSKVRKYMEMGAVGVDMEYATVLMLSAKLKLELGAVFVVSDLLSEDPRSGFRTAGFTSSFNELLTALARILPIKCSY